MEIEGCALPEDRRYDLEQSVWARPGADDAPWRLGVMASFAAFAGRLTSITPPPSLGPLAAGRSVATIESVRLTGPVRLPVAGTLLALNAEVVRRPKLVNDDPYGRGWIAEFWPDDPAPPEAPPLETASAIAERLRHRIVTERIRCYPASPDLELIEIGTECSATLARLDEELERRAPEEVVLLVTDDPSSPIELVRWSDRSGHSLLHHRMEGPLHHFLVRKERDPRPRLRSSGSGRIAGRADDP